MWYCGIVEHTTDQCFRANRLPHCEMMATRRAYKKSRTGRGNWKEAKPSLPTPVLIEKIPLDLGGWRQQQLMKKVDPSQRAQLKIII
ncbi:hypothetical protein Tco_1305071 [Tanacetum coccineum]